MPNESWFINMDHKGSIDSQLRGKITRSRSGLAKARWQDSNFLASIVRLSSLDRWEKQCAMRR